jgi:hypothetical protein
MRSAIEGRRLHLNASIVAGVDAEHATGLAIDQSMNDLRKLSLPSSIAWK